MREAQKSEPSPKENKPSPKKQVQGDHERRKKASPGSLKPKRRNIKKEKKKKKTHGKRLNSQDPQQPSRGADPSKRTVKRRLRQLERKGQERKIRNRAKATSAKRPNKKRRNNQRPLMAPAGSVSGNQNRGIRKGEWQQATFKSA